MTKQTRPLEKVECPSGVEAKIVQFFTRGEDKAIEEKKWKGAEVNTRKDGTVVVEKVPVLQRELTRDGLVLFGVKEYDEKKVTEKTLENMRVDDFDFLVEELTKVRAGKKN